MRTFDPHLRAILAEEMLKGEAEASAKTVQTIQRDAQVSAPYAATADYRVAAVRGRLADRMAHINGPKVVTAAELAEYQMHKLAAVAESAVAHQEAAQAGAAAVASELEDE